MDFPNIIHQIFFKFPEQHEIPKKWLQNHEEWKRIHPQYIVKLWSSEMSEELIRELDIEFLDIYNNYPHEIQRVDAIRYFILYKYGGLYVDLDTLPSRDITPLLNIYFHNNTKVLLAKSQNMNNSASNWFMASTPKNTFWLHVIEEMKKRSKIFYITKHITVMQTTGPGLLNDVMKKHPTDVTLASKSLLSTCTICGNCKSNTFIIDDHATSWGGDDTRLLNKLFCSLSFVHYIAWYKWVCLIILFIVLLCVVYSRLVYCRKRCLKK